MDQRSSSSPDRHTRSVQQKEEDRPQAKTKGVFIADQCPGRTGDSYGHWDSHAYTRFSYGSNPRRRMESGIKQRTLDTQDLLDLYTKGSQGVCFVLLDVGLSQLMPNTRQLDRFFPHGTKVVQIQPYLLTKVKIGKFIEEIEHVDVHCFTTYNISIKTGQKQGQFCSFCTKQFPFKTIAFLAVNLTFWMHTGSYPAKSSVNR